MMVEMIVAWSTLSIYAFIVTATTRLDKAIAGEILSKKCLALMQEVCPRVGLLLSTKTEPVGGSCSRRSFAELRTL